MVEVVKEGGGRAGAINERGPQELRKNRDKDSKSFIVGVSG